MMIISPWLTINPSSFKLIDVSKDKRIANVWWAPYAKTWATAVGEGDIRDTILYDYPSKETGQKFCIDYLKETYIDLIFLTDKQYESYLVML